MQLLVDLLRRIHLLKTVLHGKAISGLPMPQRIIVVQLELKGLIVLILLDEFGYPFSFSFIHIFVYFFALIINF